MSKFNNKPRVSSLVLALTAAAVTVASYEDAMAQTDIGNVNVVHREAAKAKKPKKVVHASAPRPAPKPVAVAPSRPAAPRVVHAAPTHSARARVASHVARPAVVAAGAGSSAVGAPGLPISAPNAVGSRAPLGSAPALAISQAPLTSIEPTSIVSDKIIRDVIQPSADFNEIVKYTPGWASTASNGLIGDTNKGGWRGFADGQYNVTFDGIPFGDENNPSHHSASYFPSGFIGQVTVDRGPGPASQAGYATYGGTMALQSNELSDKRGGSIENSFGSYSTFVNTETLQTGKIGNTGVRALLQYSHSQTGGAQHFGDVEQNGWLAKADKDFGDLQVTAFGTYSREHYRNVTNITYPQYSMAGSHYGAVGNIPGTEQYLSGNVSEKQTDMEYMNLKADILGFQLNNKTYTYSYWYPWWQRNAGDQTVEGLASVNPVTVKGLVTAKGDVVGQDQINNYRAWGNLFDAKRDITAGYASGQLRAGIWWERGDNWRRQPYASYLTFGQYNYVEPTLAGYQASYKLDLASHYMNYQPWVEYEWKPIAQLSVTPGYKFISFERDHNARINQTTLTPLYYNHAYRAGLPFLTVRYSINPALSVYGQASRGFKVPDVAAYYVANPDNNNVSPQTTTNYQLGAVYKDEIFTGAVDVYQITSNNYTFTITNPDKSTNLLMGGTARQRGFEVEATVALGGLTKKYLPALAGGPVGRAMEYLAIYGNGTIQDSRFLEGQFSGLYMPSAPRYTAVGGLIYDDGMYFGSIIHKQTGDQWGSGGQKYFAAPFSASAANPFGAANAYLNYIPAYATTDLAAGVRTDWFRRFGAVDKVEFKLGVTNLFDNRAVTGISGDPTGIYALNNTKLTYSFQAGRLFFGGVKFSF